MPELAASEGQTLRAQSKKAKQQGQAQSRADNTGNSNREVIKPVLANPLTVPWPALPKHLQTAAFHALKQLIPDDIPAYHTARDRCHKKERRQERSLKAREEVRQKRDAKGVLFKAAATASGEGEGAAEGDQAVEGDKGEGEAAVGDKRSLPVSSDAGVPANKKQKTALAAAASASTTADGRKDAATSSKSAVVPLGAGGADGAEKDGRSDRHSHPSNTQTPTTRAEPPASLQHLVFGINETVKALERQTDGLRLRIMQLGEALEAHDRGVKKGGAGGAVRGDNAAVAVRKQMGKGGAQGSSGAVDKETEKESAQAASGAEGAAAQQSTTAVQSDEELAGQPSPSQHLIPIPAPASLATTARGSKQKPIEYILLPLPDLNPQTLAAHIPPYCATHNTLVYQYKHLIKVAKARLQRWEWDEVCEVMGVGVGAEGEKPAGQEDEVNEVEKSNTVDKVDEVDEVRVVPLGRVQAELSGLVGLRRVACVGVRASHPDITTLRALLPKSALKPPRYSLTLPFPIPTSRLQVHGDLAANTAATGPAAATATATATATARVAPSSSTHTPAARSKKRELVPTAPSAKHASTPGPTIEAKAQAVPTLTPHIHYAPLHVKGLTTTVPADGTARKAKRMEEVRKRRRERKEMKRVM